MEIVTSTLHDFVGARDRLGYYGSDIFLAMVITALALIIWVVAGFVAAAQP